MKKKICILSTIFAILFISSCAEEEICHDFTKINSEVRSANFNSIMANRERFSRSFSKAIQNSDFFDFIVSECLSSNLNDAEILYAKLYNSEVGRTGMTFASFLTSTEQTLGTSYTDSDIFYSVTCLNSDPLLGIVLMPGKDNDNSTIGTIPNSKKVYLDKLFDEFLPTEYIKYSLNGITSSHLYGDEPSDPYLAIKQNEQYIAYDLTTELLFYNEPLSLSTCGDYVRYDDIKSSEARIVTLENIAIADKDYNSLTGGGTATPRSCTEPCLRDCYSGKDAITRIKFNHDYEGWPRGGPEFIVQYALGLNNNVTSNPLGFILTNSSRHFYVLGGKENVWYTKNRSNTALKDIQLLAWDKNIHTTDMQILWTEDDGSTSEVTIGGTFGATVKIDDVSTNVQLQLGIKTIVGGDDEIGIVVVQYCDNWTDSWGHQYTVAGPSGDLFFAQLERDY